MKRHTDNLVSQYTLIACLGIALLFAQLFKFHMHDQHDGVISPTVEHAINVHMTSYLHDTMHDNHQDNIQDHKHPTKFDINSDRYVKKVGLLNLSVLLFLIAGIIPSVPRLRRTLRQHALNTKPAFLQYLLNPPLRAPPV